MRNEPRNIAVSAEYISKVKGVSLQTVMEVTTQNALRLFPKLKLALRPWKRDAPFTCYVLNSLVNIFSLNYSTLKKKKKIQNQCYEIV